jgi:hypothetical protein
LSERFRRLPLDRAVLPGDWTVVMKTGEEDISCLLAELVGISLDIRKQGVEIHQRVRLQRREISHIVTFECVDEEERVRVDVQSIGFSSFFVRWFLFRTDYLRRRRSL